MGGVVAAGESPGTAAFKAGSRANRRWPQGPGKWTVSGRGLSTQHASEPLLCSGPSAHAWGPEMNNIQPLPGTLPQCKVTGNRSGLCRAHRTAMIIPARAQGGLPDRVGLRFEE